MSHYSEMEQELNVGDAVWTVLDGWTQVTAILPAQRNGYVIEAGKTTYTAEGRRVAKDKFPSLYRYDPINGTEAPKSYLLGKFYKFHNKAGNPFVAQCIGNNKFKGEAYNHIASDSSKPLVLMTED